MRRFEHRIIAPAGATGYAAGDPVDGATVNVYHTGTLLLATLYSDESLTPLSNPLTSDGNGRIGFYTQDNKVDLAVVKTGVVNYTETAIPIFDPSNAATEVALGDELWFGALNAYYDRNAGTWKRRDTLKLAWINRFKRTDDRLAVLRAPAGANPITWTTLVEFDNAGKLTVGDLIDIQVFTANGTWTKPPNAGLVYAELVGGGGGGASGGAAVSGSGGGGGAKARRWFLASALGATEAVVVGAGGPAGIAGAASSFGSLNAYGGGTGIQVASSSGGGGGGTAGVGANGTSAASSLGGLPAQTAGAIGLSGQGGGGINLSNGQPAEQGGGGGGGLTAGNIGQNGGRSMDGAGGGGSGSPVGANGGTGGATNSWGTAGGGAGATVDNTAGGAGANGGAVGEGAGGGGGRGAGAGGAGGVPGGGGGGAGAGGGTGGTGGRGEVRVYTFLG